MVELIGQQGAKKLMLCGGQFDGATAKQMGLADEAWPDEAFATELRDWVGALAARPAAALRETKALLREMQMLEHAHWERRSVEAFQKCYATEPAQQAVQRFMRRRAEAKGNRSQTSL